MPRRGAQDGGGGRIAPGAAQPRPEKERGVRDAPDQWPQCSGSRWWMVTSPRSPVRMRTASSTGRMKILPSPISPARAAAAQHLGDRQPGRPQGLEGGLDRLEPVRPDDGLHLPHVVLAPEIEASRWLVAPAIASG